MKTYSYTPYYQGPTPTNPMLDNLSAEEQEQKFEEFYADTSMHFEELGYTVERNTAGLITITTDIPEKDCHEFVKRILINLDLHAYKS